MIFKNQELYGVLGNPVRHSLSPYLFNLWKQKREKKHAYFPLFLEEKNVEAFFLNFKQSGIKGINITKPYKEIALEYVDHVSKEVQEIGATNILINKHGILRAENSDADGFIKSLPEKIKSDFKEKRIRILGAGGSAKAILYACKKKGVHTLELTSRNMKKTQKVFEKFKDSNLINWQVIDWEERDKRDNICNKKETMNKSVDLIINTTPSGLKNSEGFNFDFGKLSSSCYIMDLVYNPFQTMFLNQAKKHNLEIQNGLKMFIEQARITYKLFFGSYPEDPENLIEILQSRINQMNLCFYQKSD